MEVASTAGGAVSVIEGTRRRLRDGVRTDFLGGARTSPAANGNASQPQGGLCGETPWLVVLDEPTAGTRPFSRTGDL